MQSQMPGRGPHPAFFRALTFPNETGVKTNHRQRSRSTAASSLIEGALSNSTLYQLAKEVGPDCVLLRKM